MKNLNLLIVLCGLFISNQTKAQESVENLFNTIYQQHLKIRKIKCEQSEFINYLCDGYDLSYFFIEEHSLFITGFDDQEIILKNKQRMFSFHTGSERINFSVTIVDDNVIKVEPLEFISYSINIDYEKDRIPPHVINYYQSLIPRFLQQAINDYEHEIRTLKLMKSQGWR